MTHRADRSYRINAPHPRGFTLLELIGVLAVMAILAGALAPNLITLLDEGYETAERDSLRTIADSLERSIRSTKTIPSALASEWSTSIAQFSSFSATRVLENDKGCARRLYIDPRFLTTTDQAFGSFAQDQGLGTPPVSPRMMLVSRLDGTLSTALSTHAQFEAVWEQTSAAALVESKKLLIQRIHLAPLFHRVILSNSNSQLVSYQLENQSEAAIAAANSVSDGTRTFYALTDTRLTLRAAPYPGGAVLLQRIIDSDTSLRYQFNGTNWVWVD